jgi:hypothetical protein
LPVAAEVVQVLAEQHGVCVRPLAMRRIDTTTGRVDVVPVACGSTREDQCRPCADKARRLRMAQCREGWHLETEPITERARPSEEQQELMAARADLVAAYAECKAHGDEASCEQISDSVAELDTELRAAGVRGRLAPLDPPSKPVKRSTRRRQDAPDLPRRSVERRTIGQVFAGKYRPSTFLTLTLDSYGRVDSDGVAVDPESYDYRRAARDAIHFAALIDRFWQNTRRCVGWDVQYFGTVEPQKRGAPHFHAAIRGAIPRAELRSITAATYHQVWWPPHDQLVYSADRLPVWDIRAKAFIDPDTGQRLPTWEQACEALLSRHMWSASDHRCMSRESWAAPRKPVGTSVTSLNTSRKALTKPPVLVSAPPPDSKIMPGGCTPNSASHRAHHGAPSGFSTASNLVARDTPPHPAGARAKPTSPST